MNLRPVYFDNHATTPIDPRVVDAMLPYLKEDFGNPESTHPYGWKAKVAVDKARAQVANLIGAEPRDIVFTSGATESTAMAILGFFEAEGTGHHFATSTVEHKATLESASHLAKLKTEVSVLPVDRNGMLAPLALEAALKPSTKMVSLIHGNNEIGTINPIQEIGEICERRKIAFHVDIAQTLGKYPINVRSGAIGLASLSAHKIYGPKGVGALFVKRGLSIQPLFSGGGQERGLRGGTVNVAGIVGFGVACEIAGRELASETVRLGRARDLLIKCLTEIPGVTLNGHISERLYNNINVTVSDVDVDRLNSELGDIAYSGGSACSGGSPSHVLKAIGREPQVNDSVLRIGLGRFNTSDDIDLLLGLLPKAIRSARGDKGSALSGTHG